MPTALYMANRTNYLSSNFDNENWREVTLQEAYEAIYWMVGNEQPQDSIARNELRRLANRPNEVVKSLGGLLFQLVPDEDFQGWNI